MKSLAAILVESGRPLELADLQFPPLKSGQVLVEITYSGVCHTQLLEVAGHRGPDPYLPHCLGHEGSGVVLEVGNNVGRCRAGDRVVLSWIKGSGADVPGTIYDWEGKKVNAGAVTTFSRHSIVSENRVTVIPAELSLRDAAWIGCAIPTGIGSVWNTAALAPGQSVAVFGTGGIGLFAVSAAKIRLAQPIIAVDIHLARLESARQLGADHLISAKEQDPITAIRDICPRGVDVAIESSGQPSVMQQALSSVRSQGGSVVVVGNARAGEKLSLDPREFNQGKRMLGTWGGDSRPDRDFLGFCQLITSRQLDLSPFSAPPYRLEEINRALDDLRTGRVTRPLIEMKP